MKSTGLFVALMGALFSGLYAASANFSAEFSVISQIVVRYEFKIVNQNALVQHDVSVELPVPISSNTKSKISYSVSSIVGDQKLATVPEGKLKLDIGDVTPLQQIPVSMVAEIASHGNVDAKSLMAHANRKSENYPLLADTSSSISGEYVSGVLQWLQGNISKSHYKPMLRSSRDVLMTRSGDCTDFSMLASDLLWLRNIPNVVVGGYVLKNSSSLLRAVDYHNWLYLYDGKQWLLMDPVNGILTQNMKSYLPFEYIDANYSGSRFNSNNKDVLVVMK